MSFEVTSRNASSGNFTCNNLFNSAQFGFHLRKSTLPTTLPVVKFQRSIVNADYASAFSAVCQDVEHSNSKMGKAIPSSTQFIAACFNGAFWARP